jgi:hypothetical protein
MAKQGRMICQNKKCNGSIFEEIYASAWIDKPELQPNSQTGKLNPVVSSGKYYYRCMSCGVVRTFHATEDDLFVS